MLSVRVRVISWATLLFVSREETQYSVAILALSWVLLALLSAILPRSSKYSLGHHGRGHFIDTSVGSGLVQFQILTYHAPRAAKHPAPTSE